MTKQHSLIYQLVPLDLQQWVFVVHFVVLLLGVFWRFNYENSGLGWLGCKNPLNSIYFHFLFVWTCVIISLAFTTYLSFQLNPTQWEKNPSSNDSRELNFPH
jgi:hypothetical protein